MKNLFAALLCSILLHAGLVTLLYLSETEPGRTVWTGASGKKSAPLNITLKLISSEAVRTTLGKVPAEHGNEVKESVPPPAPPVNSDNSASTPSVASTQSETSSQNETSSRSAAESADQPPQEGVTYYPSSQLTSRPMPLNDVMLGSAETLFVASNGAIILSLWINELGEVVEAVVETADIPEEIASGVVAAFKQLRFTPGMLADQKVRVVMRIEVSVN